MPSNTLQSDIKFLKGVGPRRGEVLAQAGVRTFEDLLYYYPRRYLDRSQIVPIGRLTDEMHAVTVVGKVIAQDTVPGGRGRTRFEVVVMDAHGHQMKCVWFHGVQWISKVFQPGDLVAFHGSPQQYARSFSMAHPDFDKLGEEGAQLDTGRIIALYTGGKALQQVGLTSRSFRRIVYHLLKTYGTEIRETLPEDLIERLGLMDRKVALRAIHFPRSSDELDAARRRLKFDELFLLQLLLAIMRSRHHTETPGHVFSGPGELTARFLNESLPFELTAAQQKAIADIERDTQTGHQMNRLIQGDVGSGKTVVAIAAMLMAIDSGFQAAFLAPTEILAEQHFASLRQYLDPIGVETRLLIGAQRKVLREEILSDLAEGHAHVAVGTHALIEEKIAFKSLGLAVVDEQHRFGVMQRAKLFEKGERPHMLLMTATPIPRSLAMTLYGDLDVTLIREKPPGRRPIITALRFENKRQDVYDFVRTQLREGRQAYVVYPLVEESEKMDLKDAESGFEKLQAEFRPYRVDMIHGRMLPYEKEEAMDRFKRGETDLLVSTTVIEVGVDVPNATIMIVEHAERFGLSQLHQLRGRVGRGAEQSYCILMADYKRSNEAKMRLETMVRTDDGFEISEVDLKIRGAGDFFGTRQTGLPDLKIADITQDLDILNEAREAAFELIGQDPQLRRPAHSDLRDHFARTAPKSLGFARIG